MKHLAKVLILIGVMLVLIPIIGSTYTSYQQKQLYEVYQSNQSMLMQSEEQAETSSSEPAYSELEQSEQEIDIQHYTPNDVEVIGLISIPKIDIEVLMVEGVSDKALKYAVGHMPDTALPGEVGNCSLAGHRSYTFGKYFNRLNELEAGDEIRLIYDTEAYVYEVYDSFLVLPTEVSVIEPQGDESIVTLITCHPVRNPTHRLIVRGKLK